MKIGGMGGLEIVIILVVVLLIFGPKNLPKLGSAIGKTVSNLRSGINDGKKKDDSVAKAEGDSATSSANDGTAGDSKPLEIEGEVEEIVFETDDDEDTKSFQSTESAPEGESATTTTRKVRRVVKKKA